MQRSKLDEIYSLSNKITCKEMISKFENYEKLWQEEKAELNNYIDPFTNKVKSDIIILRDKCPLCDSKDLSYLFIKDGFDHMVCNSCDLIFTLQLLDQTKIKYMEEGKEGDNYGKYKEMSTVKSLDRKKFEIVFEQLKQYADIKNVFDIGSQSGTFLDWAAERYSIIGHEYHRALRKAAIRKGHTVLNDNLETMQLDREFDLITLWDYIDHVINPREVIKNITKFLRPGGLFFFAINNRDSLSARMLHKDSTIFIGPHHTMHYGINQLKLLMKDYELLHAESYASELNWISNWLNFKNPNFGDAPLMFDLFDPKKICDLGMGVKLNVIFRNN